MSPVASEPSPHFSDDSDSEIAPPPDSFPQSQPQKRTLLQRTVPIIRLIAHHFKNHVGAGLVASVAYFDPGNWSVDLQAGSEFGYKLLFTVLLAGLGAVVLQSLATKLGVVTGYDIAQHCRRNLYNRPKHTMLYRWLILYPLYVLAELAIIATDLAELLGSAIAIVLLVPSMPLFVAVLITAFDVFIILLVSDPGSSKRPVRMFEYIVIILVMVVFISFIILIIEVKPLWGETFKGFLPSKTLIKGDALFTSIGILGATVMPHALFLGSALATQDRVARSEIVLPGLWTSEARAKLNIKQYTKSLFAVARVDDVVDEKQDRSRLPFIREHLKHGRVDMILSLLGFAVTINSAILILASTVFFFGVDPSQRGIAIASLFDAFDLINGRLGRGAAVIFAIALLCAGQSAAITATLSGQIVSEGFIAWRMSPFLTRSLTRMLALIPASIVAAIVGKDGINTLLVLSQVILSLILPFVVFPLVWFTSSKTLMTVESEPTKEGEQGTKVSYANGLVLQIVAWALFVIIVVADVAALVTLFIGDD